MKKHNSITTSISRLLSRLCHPLNGRSMNDHPLNGRSMGSLLLCGAVFALLSACGPALDPENTDDNNPEEDPTEEVRQPLFPVGEEKVDGVAQPKGAVKSITKYIYYEDNSTIWSKVVTTLIYDEYGRPAREDVVAYDYDQNGQPDGNARKWNQYFYFLSDGTLELRARTSSSTTTMKAELNSDELISRVENGYYNDDKWTVTSSYSLSYEQGRCSAWTNTSGDVKNPWKFYWTKSNVLDEAREQWPSGSNVDPDEDGTEYYIYDGTKNPTLGCAYDISALVTKCGGGYYYNGLGSEKLPAYVNTAYRNKAKVFTYNFRNGVLEDIFVEVWPFAADDPDWNYVKKTSKYIFTYYK